MKIYFSDLGLLVTSFMGQVYFRCSKHLGIHVTEVIQKKFMPEMRLLIAFYSEEIRQEQREIDKIEYNNN